MTTSKGKLLDAYKKVAGFVTELKMDHANGAKKSDRLNQFLGFFTL